MTDESQDQVEQPEAPETKPRPADLPDDQEWRNDVEFTPEQQRRFNRLYAQQKQSDRVAKELGELNRGLLERMEKIEAEQSQQKTTAVVNGIQTKIAEAYQAGDVELATKLTDQLIAERVKDAKPKEQPKERPKADEPKTETYEFSPEQQQELLSWAGQKDDQGNPVRPWADPGHPQHRTALSIGAGILEDNQDSGKTMTEILREVDRAVSAYLNPTSKSRSPSVLSPDGNVRSERRPSQKMTRDEELTAERMYPDLAAKDPKAAVERYRKAREKAGVQ